MADNIQGQINSLKELKKAYREAMDEAARGTSGAVENAAALRDQLDDLNDSLNQARGSGVEKLTSSLGNLKDGFLNLDPEKIVLGFQGISSTISNIKFGDIIGGIKSFGSTMASVGATLLTNPIFLIAAALAAIGGALYALNEDAQETAQAQVEAYQKVEKAITTRYDREIELAKAAGTQTFDLEQKKLAAVKVSTEQQIAVLEELKDSYATLSDEQVKQLETLKEKSSEITQESIQQYKLQTIAAEKQTEKNIASAEAAKEKMKKLLEEATEDNRKELEKQQKDREAANALILAANKKLLADIRQNEINGISEQNLRKFAQAVEDNKRAVEEINTSKATAEVKNQALLSQQQTFVAAITAINKEETDKRNADEWASAMLLAEQEGDLEAKKVSDKQKIWEDEQKKYKEHAEKTRQTAYDTVAAINDINKDGSNETLKLVTGISSSILTSIDDFTALAEMKFANSAEKMKAYVQAAGAAIQSTLSAISEYNQAKAEEAVKVNEESLNTQLTALETSRDAELAKEGLTADQKVAIENKYKMQKYQLELAEYNNNTAIKKKAFEQDKKMKIAQAVISTIVGAVSAVTGMISAIPGPVGIILGVVAGLAVTAAGVLQVAKIRATTFDAGQPPAAPQLTVPSSVGAGGAGAAGSSSPDFSLFNKKKTNDGSANNASNQGSGNQPPITVKAVVVSQEITDSQTQAAYSNNMGSL